MAEAPLTIGRLACSTGVTVETVRYYQRRGFTLQEIGNLLDLGDGHCEDVHELAKHKYSEIKTQIADLLAMKKGLKRLLGDCETRNGTETCPIVETFVGRNHRLADRN